MTVFGSRLQEIRNMHGLTQKELATKLGLSTSTIGMYESGRREPNLSQMAKIATELGVDLSYLLGETDILNNLTFDYSQEILDFKFRKNIKELGQAISNKRIRKNISQQELAELCQTNLSYISDLEFGVINEINYSVSLIISFLEIECPAVDYLFIRIFSLDDFNKIVGYFFHSARFSLDIGGDTSRIVRPIDVFGEQFINDVENKPLSIDSNSLDRYIQFLELHITIPTLMNLINNFNRKFNPVILGIPVMSGLMFTGLKLSNNSNPDNIYRYVDEILTIAREINTEKKIPEYLTQSIFELIDSLDRVEKIKFVNELVQYATFLSEYKFKHKDD